MRSLLLIALPVLLAACVLRPPPEDTNRRGDPTFRATGNEPGWIVTVYPDSLVFLTNYGEDRYVFTRFITRPSGGGTYQTMRPDPHFEMRVSDEPCVDDMSGEPYEAAVLVTFDGWTYDGCGSRLVKHDSS